MGPDLPPLQTALLDATTVERLFSDIAAGAELVSVSIKMRTGAYASEGAASLTEARATLDRSEVLGVQLRYRLGAAIWCDTLIRSGAEFRLVRAELPAR